jgi:hypothetical protein
MIRVVFVIIEGVRTSDNKNTCPVLALHTWNKAKQNVSTQHGHLGLGAGSGGQYATQLTQAGKKDEIKTDHDENIIILPIEDIIRIKVSTEVKRTVEQSKTVRIKTPPPEDLSCPDEVKKCCIKNVCCWCCKEKKVAPEHVTMKTERVEASRVIVVSIEQVEHSLLHTPSNVQVLSTANQHEFYQKNLNILEPLKFYYLHNAEFDNKNYEKNFNESETLARVVMQLKAMVGYYPDQSQLQQIIGQQYVHVFGYQPKESVPILPGEGTTETAVVRKRQPIDE